MGADVHVGGCKCEADPSSGTKAETYDRTHKQLYKRADAETQTWSAMAPKAMRFSILHMRDTGLKRSRSEAQREAADIRPCAAAVSLRGGPLHAEMRREPKQAVERSTVQVLDDWIRDQTVRRLWP